MHRLKNLGRLAGAIATVTMLVPYPASAQQPSEQAQLFSLVSQAESHFVRLSTDAQFKVSFYR